MRCPNLSFSAVARELDGDAGQTFRSTTGEVDAGQAGVTTKDGKPALLSLYFQQHPRELEKYLKLEVDLATDMVTVKRDVWTRPTAQPTSSLQLTPPRTLSPRERAFLAERIKACTSFEPGSDTDVQAQSELNQAAGMLERE